jgi:hypothetical protein
MARRPTPRPRDKAEEFINERESRRLERLDDGPSRAEMELGPLMRPQPLPAPSTSPQKIRSGWHGYRQPRPDLGHEVQRHVLRTDAWNPMSAHSQRSRMP